MRWSWAYSVNFLTSSMLLRQMLMLIKTRYRCAYCLRRMCSRLFCEGTNALGRLGCRSHESSAKLNDPSRPIGASQAESRGRDRSGVQGTAERQGEGELAPWLRRALVDAGRNSSGDRGSLHRYEIWRLLPSAITSNKVCSKRLLGCDRLHCRLDLCKGNAKPNLFLSLRWERYL